MTTSLRELAYVFLKLGSTAFGGPAAHIAMMEADVVRKRAWLTHDEFLDLLGATNLIPGPNSTEMAIHIGYRQAGWPGLLVAGSCFILPAFFMVAALAWGYVTYGNLPAVNHVLYGIKPVVIAVILQALWNLSKSALKTRLLVVLGIVAASLNLMGVNELVVLFGVGLFMILHHRLSRNQRFHSLAFWPSVWQAPVTPPVTPSLTLFGLWPLFWFFLKVGSVLFGSGYVLIAFLQGELVSRLGWLTQSQLLDAVAVGQVTPGPVFTTATFIGYLLGGWPGAVVATLGIFLPAFFFVAVSGPFISRLRQSASASAFLDGVNVAAVALMLVVTLRLAGSALVDPVTISLALVSAVLLVRVQVNSAWLLLLGVVVGLMR